MPTPRRHFLKLAAGGAAGLALWRVAAAATTDSTPPRSGENQRRRYALVGTGSRSYTYLDALVKSHREYGELVALADTNPGRLALAREHVATRGAPAPRTYAAAEFDRLIAETKPDVVIVTTIDATHHEYLIRAMDAGCDVVTEKPMTTTAEKCQTILDARRRTGRSCRVLFNYRYSPPRTQVKELLMSGEIGDILSVDFQWLLNTRHGADYFRRWHSRKENSGGLLVHKSTHHFDLVNWWLSAMPIAVSAVGKREFYTPALARRLGLQSHHERCLTCPEKNACAFHLDLAASPGLKRLYLDQENHDGYFRDRCVFRPDIDIEDTMNAIVRYDTGATLSYSLNAFNAWEGYQIAFNGTRGRLEHSAVEQIYVNGTDTVQGGFKSGGVKTRVIPLRGAAREIKPWAGVGGHGGGDSVMLDDLFLPQPPADKYLRAADERAGAASILVGIAANRCIETGVGSVALTDVLPHLARPDFAPMPTRDTPLAMPGV
jgi:predicted dehydrogenase